MDRVDNFSLDGLYALYDHLIESSDDSETDYELDVIALCCEFSEDTIENVLKEHNLDSLDELHAETVVVWSDDTNVLYQCF
jgi:hypothetical protein